MLPDTGAESPPNERTDGRKEGEMYRQLSKQILGKEGDMLGNELSAPYEIPQFPIEQIQSKLQRVRGGEGSKVRCQNVDYPKILVQGV